MVLAASSLSAASCGQTISFDLSFGKGKGASASANSRAVSKTLWTCCVEAITEYCRITFDLFPARYQLCVAAVDEAKCQPINSWRDEDQEIGKVRGQRGRRDGVGLHSSLVSKIHTRCCKVSRSLGSLVSKPPRAPATCPPASRACSTRSAAWPN